LKSGLNCRIVGITRCVNPARLNPFEIRAELPLAATRIIGVQQCVSIPLKSGLNCRDEHCRIRWTTAGLNPFEIRAELPPHCDF